MTRCRACLARSPTTVDLARIHHLGFGFDADDCAPVILTLLEPVRERGGLVVELGCGSGLLTKYLVDAGHRVIATDASPVMLDIARAYVGDAVDPTARAPGRSHPRGRCDRLDRSRLQLSADALAIDRALVASARALRPDGVYAINSRDLTWGTERSDSVTRAWVGDDWALVTEVSLRTRDRFVRQMATFTRNDDGSWRRDDERHDNILIDTRGVPGLLAPHGVEAQLGDAFGSETPTVGLRTVTGPRARTERAVAGTVAAPDP
jgi:SAM-dependent methyltransferase